MEPRIICYRNYDMASDLNEYKIEMVILHAFRCEENDVLAKLRYDNIIYDENTDSILQARKEFEFGLDIHKIYM